MSNSQNIAVRVDGVTKSFRIPLEGSSGLKQKIINSLRGRKGYRDFTPLKNISFEINKGDFFGIVGKNGSGKSTLLKTIAGIYNPNEGSVQVNGSLVPFIELGVGFNPELTGKENVFLNGALLGFSYKEVSNMYSEIVEFAELSEFMEERLKNYSSGMQVRLAFSIAIKAQGDILLLDEVLAVGDAAFQQKCFDYFEELKRNKRTIIIVTHDMGAVKRFCNRALIIRDGMIEAIGSPSEIADIYSEQNIELPDNIDAKDESGTNLKLSINKKRYKPSDRLTSRVTYEPLNGIDSYVNLSLVKNGLVVADLNTKYNKELNIQKKEIKLQFTQQLDMFNAGTYDIYISIHQTGDDHLIKQIPRAATFIIEGHDKARDGALRLDDGWTLV